MFCTNCGAAVPADGKFCGGCGRVVEGFVASENAEAGTDSRPEAAALPLDATDLPWASPRVQRDQGRSTTPRPWIRFWAKLVDVWLWVIVLGLLVGLLFPRWSAETNETLVGLILLACTVPIHALLLSTSGTTVGKALFNIKVTHNGRKLTFGQALGREVLVYLRGFGLGIPIVSLFTQIAAYGDLKKVGSSSWDRENGNVVTHNDPGVAGVIGAIAILGSAFTLMLLGTMAGQGY